MTVETELRTTEILPESIETERSFELDDATIDARFVEIVEAEKRLADANPVERERRERAVMYKPNGGYDVKQMQPVGVASIQ